MKNHLLAIAILSSTQLIIPFAFVQAEEAVDLYSLCSRFPHNSQCKNFQAPIALDRRSGKEAQCAIADSDKLAKCKIKLKETTLNLYVENGDKLPILDDHKNTQEIIVPLANLKSFTYSERKKVNVGKVLAFGVWGLLAKKKTATFNFNVNPSKATLENKKLKQFAFVMSRDIGREFRQNIEQKTNLVPEVFLDID